MGSIAEWSAHEAAADLAEQSAPLGGWVNNAAIDLQGGAHEVDVAHIERGLQALCTGPTGDAPGTAQHSRAMPIRLSS